MQKFPYHPQVRPALLSLVFALTACGIADARVIEGSFERTLTVSGPLDLDIRSDSGHIKVVAGPPGEVRINGRIRASTGFRVSDSEAEDKVRRLESNPPVEQSGNSVRIGRIGDPELERRVSISYEVVVPVETRVNSQSDSGGQDIQGIRGPVTAHADSGGLTIVGIAESVEARTDSGGQRISNIGGSVQSEADSGGLHIAAVRGAVTARTDSGGIHASDVTGAFEAEADSGAVRADGVGGGVSVRTDSGSVKVTQSTPGPINIRTDSAGVRLQIAASAAYDVEISTDSGGIKFHHPLDGVTASRRNKQLSGKLRGGGQPLVIRTDSGSITVD
jgi:hypothetical protein